MAKPKPIEIDGVAYESQSAAAIETALEVLDAPTEDAA